MKGRTNLMSTALAPQPPSTASETTHAYVNVCRRLTRIGVTLALSPLPWAEAAYWHADTHTLHLNRDASLREHLNAMAHLLHYTAAGPGASIARPAPPLRVVH